MTILSRLLFEEGQFLSKVWVSQDPRGDEDLDIVGIVAREVSEDLKSDNEEGWGEKSKRKVNSLSRDIILVAQTKQNIHKYFTSFHTSFFTFNDLLHVFFTCFLLV